MMRRMLIIRLINFLVEERACSYIPEQGKATVIVQALPWNIQDSSDTYAYDIPPFDRFESSGTKRRGSAAKYMELARKLPCLWSITSDVEPHIDNGKRRIRLFGRFLCI
jgi:hypothetical protein